MAAKKKSARKSGTAPTTRARRQVGQKPGTSTGTLDSRAQLIDVTLRILMERGVDAVRIDEVVEEVGVTTGSLYWHFEDRQGLIKAAIAEQIQRLSAETIAGVSDAIAHSATKDDYLARITPFLVDPFDAARVRERWGRLAILVETQNDPELAAMMHDVQSRHLEIAVELMESAQRRGFLRDDLDPRAVATALNVINLGSSVIDVLGENGPDPAAWWGLIGFFIDALFPPDAPHS